MKSMRQQHRGCVLRPGRWLSILLFFDPAAVGIVWPVGVWRTCKCLTWVSMHALDEVESQTVRVTCSVLLRLRYTREIVEFAWPCSKLRKALTWAFGESGNEAAKYHRLRSDKCTHTCILSAALNNRKASES